MNQFGQLPLCASWHSRGIAVRLIHSLLSEAPRVADKGAELPPVRVLQLSPAVVSERIVRSDGKAMTVYRCPYPAEGPIRVVTTNGVHALVYMYAHYVFSRPQNTVRVDIGHGTVERWIPLWPAQPISGEWSPRALSCFGEWWALRHLAKFRHPPLVAANSHDKSHSS
jgi:hypothetical protein